MELVSSTPSYDVLRDGDQAIKVAKDERSAKYLINSLDWCNSTVTESGLIIPEAQRLDDLGQGQLEKVSFGWIEGEQLKEEGLPDSIPLIANGLVEMMQLDVDWVGSPDEWLEGRLNSLRSVWPHELGLNLNHLSLAKLRAGVTHGDYALKNMIATPSGRLGLIDPEFGTHSLNLDFAVPRMHDTAYFYHLLLCQFQSEDLGKQFLEEIEGMGILRADQDRLEFWTSVLERTLSMYRNFIVNPKSGFEVDVRRKNPEPYLKLLSGCIGYLWSSEET